MISFRTDNMTAHKIENLGKATRDILREQVELLLKNEAKESRGHFVQQEDGKFLMHSDSAFAISLIEVFSKAIGVEEYFDSDEYANLPLPYPRTYRYGGPPDISEMKEMLAKVSKFISSLQD
jgi:hypothetical protein